MVKPSFIKKRTQAAVESRPYIVGIDPGYSGVLSVLDIDSRQIVDQFDMPIYKTPTKSRRSGSLRHLDVHKLSSFVDNYSKNIAIVVLEEPGAMPKQGLSSTFRFGHTCGLIHGVMAGHYLPVYPVKPAVWKLALGLGYIKEEALNMANKLWPSVQDQGRWALKKHHDRAESALIAYYGIIHLEKLVAMARVVSIASSRQIS